MMEPIQGEAGVYPVDPDYMFEATKLARRNGALFIADEVQTGIYRCGTQAFEFQNAGITPDIFTFAKGVASGFPCGGCAARIEVAEAFEPGDHGSTFGGSNLAMAAAHATLTTLNKGGFGQRVEELGDYFADKLLALDEVTEVRGSGLMIGADLKEGIKAPYVVEAGLDAGFLLNATGEHTLRFLPPLIITEEEIDKLIDALPGLCVASVAKEKELVEAEARAKQAAEDAAAQAEKAAFDAETEALKSYNNALKAEEAGEVEDEEYAEILKQAEQINDEFKEVMDLLQNKLGLSKQDINEALAKSAEEKKKNNQ
jgi:hypothetical protein